MVLQPHTCRNTYGLGYSPFARHYLGNHYLFSIPTGTKMFQFPAFASIVRWIISLQDIGLSHSEIRGSKVICTYPQLIAAYHVLHRLREPRHPPCALAYFPYHVTLTGSAGWYILQAFVLFYLLVTSCHRTSFLVENNGFEPLTPCVQSRCSSQLS